MSREIILDTETTGLDPLSGHRLVEIGCVELINFIPTGKHFHRYINPERDMPPEAQAVHGLSAEFLAGHPTFGEIVAEFIAFIADSPLVIHNAEFDMKFLNYELQKFGFAPMPLHRAVDTVRLARNKFPGAPASLDALCKRFNVDLSERTLHGALLDANLLASVYLELIGGRQADLNLASGAGDSGSVIERIFRAARPFAVPAEEQQAHVDMLKLLKNPLWGGGA